jgi:excisionase family DNA binding protein
MNMQEFYTAKEISDKLKLNVMTIYRYINSGKIKAYKIGKEFRVEKEEFEEFLNRVKIK